MKILSLFLVFAALLSFAACGTEQPPADTTDPADTAETTPAETTPAETEPPVIPTGPWKEAFEVTSEDGSYTLSFSEPSVVVQGDEGDTAWGHYTFPGLAMTKDGYIICSWHYGNDDIKYTATSGSRMTVNQGKSWMMTTMLDSAAPTRLMKDGNYFQGFVGKGAYRVTYWNEHKHGFFYGNKYLYFAEDFADKADVKVQARIYDPEAKTTNTVDCTINWPYMPLKRYSGGLVYPVGQIFALSAGNVIVIDGDLYTVIYTDGFNSMASSREEAVDEYCAHSAAYVFRSTDCGYTWDFLSQVRIDADTFSDKANFEGFTEPKMKQMPDGSLVMLLRTGSEHPSYIVRSTDMGKTWTKPVKFDDLGVLPQLLTLPCGVTLASYGRPELRVRATTDPAGMDWDDPVTLPMSAPEGTKYMKTSCFYTNMLQLDDNRVMLAYTDFNYPNKNGVPVHTVLTRIITVTVNEE